MNIILASKSPYRKELLERLNIDFETLDSSIDESQFKNTIEDPEKLVLELSFQKANKVGLKNIDSLIIGSDQVLSYEGKIFGKPKSVEKAIEQLTLLSGKTHQLITGVCLLYKEQPTLFIDKTSLTMRNLSKSEIEEYIKIDAPLDCAGSYKIEKLGIALFSKIKTNDFTSIIGLPLIQLSNELRELGIKIP